MKKNLKRKLHVFWEKHKTGILLTGGIVIIFFLGNIRGNIDAFKIKQKMAEEDEKKEYEEKKPEDNPFREDPNDPKNRFPAGGVVVEDWLYEHDCPLIDVNDIPLNSMGEFGAEIKRRYKENFPDWKETGMMNPDKLLVSVDLAVEHVYQDEEEKKEETVA